MTEILSFLVTQARGLIFAQSLPASCDANYIGNGISVNNVNAPIFYYRPKGSDVFRVIYPLGLYKVAGLGADGHLFYSSQKDNLVFRLTILPELPI